MSIVKDGQKSVRVVLPEDLYKVLKKECPDHGDLSKLIRKLIIKHLEGLRDDDRPKSDQSTS